MVYIRGRIAVPRIPAAPPEGGDLMSPSMASVPYVASVRHNTFEVCEPHG